VKASTPTGRPQRFVSTTPVDMAAVAASPAASPTVSSATSPRRTIMATPITPATPHPRRHLVGCSPSNAKASMVTAGAITNRIDRLVAKDLVTRDLDPANRRAVIIALTTKGRRLIDKAVVAHLDNEQRLLAHLSAEDQERLATLLRDLLIALDDTPPAPSAPERP
jgi:uncharacterized Rossmann fold enzyme